MDSAKEISIINSTKCTLWCNFVKDLDQYEQLRKMDFIFNQLGTSGFLNNKGSLVLKGRFTIRQLLNLEKLYMEPIVANKLTNTEKLDHLHAVDRDNKLEKEIESLFVLMDKYFSPEIQDKPVVKNYTNNIVLNCLKKAILLNYKNPCEDEPNFYVHMMKAIIEDVL